MVTWNRYTGSKAGRPKTLRDTEDVSAMDVLDALDERDYAAPGTTVENTGRPEQDDGGIDVPDTAKDPEAGYGTQTQGDGTWDVEYEATPMGAEAGGVNGTGEGNAADLMPDVKDDLDAVGALENPDAPGAYDGDEDLYSIAALREAQEAERAALEEQMLQERQSAQQNAAARSGAGGLGILGASGALAADIGGAKDRERALALAELDRRYRGEERAVEEAEYARAEDAEEDALRDEGSEFADLQRKVAVWALEDEYGTDIDGDGTAGFPDSPDVAATTLPTGDESSVIPGPLDQASGAASEGIDAVLEDLGVPEDTVDVAPAAPEGATKIDEGANIVGSAAGALFPFLPALVTAVTLTHDVYVTLDPPGVTLVPRAGADAFGLLGEG